MLETRKRPLRRTDHSSRWRLHMRRWVGPLIGSLAALTFALGLAGFTWQYVAKPHEPFDFTIPLFKTVQLFLLNSGAEDDADHPSNVLLILARVSASLLFVVVSLTVILRVLDEIRRLPHQLTLKGHTVICGLGQIGLQLLDDLKSRDPKTAVVVIEPNEANPWLEYARNQGADVVVADATRASALREARAEHAAEVFAVTGDDGANLEVAAELADVLAKSDAAAQGAKTRLYLHVVDTQLAISLQPNVKALHDNARLAVQVFNVPRSAAARLVTRRLHRFTPTKPDEVAHFVIVGFGAMGQALAAQLAQLGHHANRKRARFTIADPDPATFRTFLSRHPRFTSWSHEQLGSALFSDDADRWDTSTGPLPPSLRVEDEQAVQYACNAQFRRIETAGDEAFCRELVQCLNQPGVKPIVFVCGQKDRENFDAAVRLSEQLACQGAADVPIFVWLPRQPALAEALSGGDRFHPFGECRFAASLDEITRPLREELGQILHEDYELHAAASNPQHTPSPWSSLREGMRESNRQAADHLLVKLAHLGLRLVRKEDAKAPIKLTFNKDEIERLAQMEHNRWVAERLLTGWRFAPKPATQAELAANKARRLNHNLVPWEHLLPDDRQRDYDQVQAWLRACDKGPFRLERVEGAG